MTVPAISMTLAVTVFHAGPWCRIELVSLCLCWKQSYWNHYATYLTHAKTALKVSLLLHVN